jgi:hypothetical protein
MIHREQVSLAGVSLSTDFWKFGVLDAYFAIWE